MIHVGDGTRPILLKKQFVTRCCGLILLLVENFCKPAHLFLTSLFFSKQEYNFKPAYFCKPAHFFLTSFFFLKPGI